MNGKTWIMALCGFVAAAVVVGLVTAGTPTRSFGEKKIAGGQVGPVPVLDKKLKVVRGLSKIEQECIACHAKNEQGLIRDWSHSLHARSNVTCLDCHQAKQTDKDARDCPGTEKYSDVKISPIVTPQDCSRCHPREAEQFSRSKHARTWAIQTEEIKDPWLAGMTNEVERSVGCFTCHGSDISDGQMNDLNWPNSGSGRKNPDGSLGTCTTCHTTHAFSIAEARKPETCGQCHVGPDHPQEEIYFESKHGKRYLAHGDEWNWDAAPDAWEPGNDFAAPTCATCHMSGVGPLETTHELSVRLKWEAQAPMAVKNKDLDGDAERQQMVTVCKQCHSKRWSENYLSRYDRVIENYNENYFKPVKAQMDVLYQKGLLTKWPVFDEEIEWTYYEFWHHEGRRARMGAAMMGPDYAWWHGFYELKKTYMDFVHQAKKVEKDGHGSPVYIPGAEGKNLTGAKVKPMSEAWNAIPNLSGRTGKR